MQAGARSTRQFDQFETGCGIIQRNHQNLRLQQPCGAQGDRSGGITQKALDTEAAHQINFSNVMIQHDCLKTRGLHQAVDDLAKPANSSNNYRTLLVDFIFDADVNFVFQTTR